jgi:2-C-methyl-D-erythritol 2,4-cyclodiphosphate synthase
MIRTGIGFDSHRFTEGRPLVLGGVTIPGSRGLSGHSDADVLAHAIVDALLGAAALGDIGGHFSDKDEAWKNAPGSLFIERSLELLAERNMKPLHIDATIIAEEPKISPHVKAIRTSLAGFLKMPLNSVSVKATTNEGMGALGRGEGMAAMAVATIEEKDA